MTSKHAAYVRKWRKYRAMGAELAANFPPLAPASVNIDRTGLVDPAPAPKQVIKEATVGLSNDDQTSQLISDSDSETDRCGVDTGDEYQNDIHCYDPPPIDCIDHDLSSDDDDESNTDIVTQLANWASQAHQSGLAGARLNELLKHLIAYGLPLPKDHRTLLKIPRHIETEERCGGIYCYLGLSNGIQSCYADNPEIASHSIELLVNIDETPLYKSTSSGQFTPILVSIIYSSHPIQPFAVALFCGRGKPSPIKDFLSDFLPELANLGRDGLVLGNKRIEVKLKAFVCDAPARAYLKGIIGHTGFHACERCQITGYTKFKRRIYLSPNNELLRNDHDFNELAYMGKHQTSVSPLIELKLPCVSGFSLDYMHLVCLGVVRRIILYLKDGPSECRISHRQLTVLSNHHASLKDKLPSEFSRQPRSLFEVLRWKATEFRTFLLYTGPVVLKEIISEGAFSQFLVLSVALRILLEESDSKRSHYLNYARQLLKLFVERCTRYYGESFVVYNVHSLMHLPDDCEHFNCSLNDISAFPFENHLRLLKKSVRNGNNPVVQVAKKMKVMEKVETAKRKARRQVVTATKRNGCFILQNGDFAFIKECRSENNVVCDIIRSSRCENFFTSPCDSKLFDIVYVPNWKPSRRIVEKKEFKRKVVCLEYEDGHVLLPLINDFS